MYGEGNLELFDGNFSLSTEGWKSSFMSSSQALNPQNEFHSGSCNCKTGCISLQCACQKKGATCSTKCHSGTDCGNLPSLCGNLSSKKSKQSSWGRSPPAKKSRQPPQNSQELKPSTPHLKRLATSPLNVGCHNFSLVKVTRKYLRESNG